jgi:hypothetical protein
MLMLNRSAIVVKPKQAFLDWLHSSRDLTLLDFSSGTDHLPHPGM